MLVVTKSLQLLQIPLANCVRKYSQSKHLFQKNVIISGPLAKMIDKAQKKKKPGRPSRVAAKGMNSLTENLIPEFIDTSKSSGYSRITAGSRRRANQVSFILYDCVTQIINSGELCPIIGSMMIEITQVKMLPDFSAIHIYWSPSGTSRDEEVIKLLKEKESRMRSLITNHRLIAKIPKVLFLKDEYEARVQEMEKLFEIVDKDTSNLKPEEITKEEEEPVLYVDDNEVDKFQLVKDLFDDSVTEVIHFEKEGIALKNDETKFSILEKNKDSVYKVIKNQYRDDMYGVDHTQLQKKIEIWNEKVKHRKT